MKQCPTCGSTFTDITLRYCLADGAKLEDLEAEQETVVRVAVPGEKTERISFQPTLPGGAPAGPENTPGTTSTTGLKIMLIVALLGVAAVAVFGVLGLMYFNTSLGGYGVNRNRNVATPSPAPTIDDNDQLRQKIADLEKRLNESRSANTAAEIPDKLPMSRTTMGARVNSPGDGFLALRTLPSSQSGERILKIPHGAVVSVGACGPVSRPVSRSGRWCQASYGGYSGWVFDGYLTYVSENERK